MEILEIDVLDGNGKIPVAVGGYIDATRLRRFISDSVVAFVRNEESGLRFEDALRIARGCTDYGGGYRGNAEQYEIYQHGIQTVINALTAASKNGLKDSQTAALHAMGANAKVSGAGTASAGLTGWQANGETE